MNSASEKVMLKLLRKLFGEIWNPTPSAVMSRRPALSSTSENEGDLRESEEHFGQLVAELRDYAIFLLDSNGHVLTWNAGAERIKGYRSEEIIGQHFSRFYPQDALSSGWPAHELEVAAATGRFEDEGWRVR